MTSQIVTVKVELPFPYNINAKSMIHLWTEQSTLIKQCPAYPTTAPVQAVVTDMDGAVAQLQGTVSEIDQVRARLAALEKTRNTQMATLRIKHGAVGTALTSASNNDPNAAKAWTGATQERAKAAQVPAATGAPLNPAFNGIKRHPGSVKASCDKEAGALAYLFQFGTDPNHPETWPAPIVARGHTYTLRNQPIGQVLCARIAVVRHGSVQGAWSIVLQLTVR